jgi:hypothetical protein
MHEASLVDNALLRPVVQELLRLERDGFEMNGHRFFVKVFTFALCYGIVSYSADR